MILQTSACIGCFAIGIITGLYIMSRSITQRIFIKKGRPGELRRIENMIQNLYNLQDLLNQRMDQLELDNKKTKQ